MRSNVDLDALILDLAGLQYLGQPVQRRLGAADGGQAGGIDAGNVQFLADQRLYLVQRQRDRQHAARRHGVKQPSAQQHQVDAILEPDHTGQTGGGILAHRMAHQRCGPHAPAEPQLRQRIFHDHDQRQLHRGLLQPGVCFGGIAVGQPDGADIVVEALLQMLQPPVHPFGKDRLDLVKVARHARILRPATGEHEHHIRPGPQRVMGEHPARVALLQQAGGLKRGFGHQHAAFFEPATTLFQRIGHIGQIDVRIGAQPACQRLGIAIERGA